MTGAQGAIVALPVVAAGVALLAAWRERARGRRRDPDAIGLVSWPTVQVLALIALAVLGILALHRQ